MSDQDLFDGGDANAKPQEDQQQNTDDLGAAPTDIFADKLSSIRNEQGEPKYKTVEDALDALKHSQEFIATLKKEKNDGSAELEQLKAELEKRESVEEVVNRLMNRDPNEERQQADPPKENSLDESKVLELVQQALTQQSQSQTQASNVQMVSDKLSEQFGEKAREVLNQRAKEIGTTPQALKELSAQNPKLVLSLFAGAGVTNNESTTSSQSSNRGTPKPELPKFDKSLVRGGATQEELKDAMLKVKEYTYKQLGVVE